MREEIIQFFKTKIFCYCFLSDSRQEISQNELRKECGKCFAFLEGGIFMRSVLCN